MLPYCYRQLTFSHQQSLLKSLEEEEDSAMALHLVLVLLFYQETKSIIHIPGKFIPTMISFLHDHLSLEVYEKLVECQRLVSAQWKLQQHTSKNGDGDFEALDGHTADTKDTIHILIHDLKQLVMKANS